MADLGVLSFSLPEDALSLGNESEKHHTLLALMKDH